MLLHFVVASLVTVFAPVSSEPPEDVSWTASFVTEDEPGEPMVVTGTVYASDGKTPASGIVVYAYHTDAEGFYSKEGSGKHRIRGWMRTDRDGRYEIRSIKPGHYPSGSTPTHVHYVVTVRGTQQYYDLFFEDDPLLSDRVRRGANKGGRYLVRPIVRGDDGVWHCNADIILDYEPEGDA